MTDTAKQTEKTTTWYRVRTDEIEPFEVVKETDKYVVVRYKDYDGTTCVQRQKKNQYWCNYFKTRIKAVEYLLQNAENGLKASKQAVSDWQMERDKWQRELEREREKP